MGLKVELSKRMQAVAALVTPGSRVCDMGCDHGYVSIYLVQAGISPKVLATDVNRGPLERAKEHVSGFGLEDYITLRLSDGLANYHPGEADSLIGAGMGGRLLKSILEREPEKTRDFKELILQPQSEIKEFRRFLRKNGYFIIAEDMICEEGKFYPVIKAITEKPAGSIGGIAEKKPEACCELEDRFGPLLLKEKNPVLGSFLLKEWQMNQSLSGKLENAINERSDRKEMRLLELSGEREFLRKAAEICEVQLEE